MALSGKTKSFQTPSLNAARPDENLGLQEFSNPVIKGFNPDPSVCRVGGDFYLVTSSFEFFPGVPVYHTRNLVNWEMIGNCLTRASQLPLRQAKNSGGIWAPTIRHHAGRFYMTTTNTTLGGNFYVWATDPAGPWSEPIYVRQQGIDPSLWFDDDRKVYFASNGIGWAEIKGIYQCEINIETGEQLSETRLIWRGTGGSYPEAPHLFRYGDFYYLLIAEGGTQACHMVTIARSRNPYGPFEPCPHNPILSNRSLESPIQSTGHADIFADQNGHWWAVFLAVRPHKGTQHLGRETCLAPVHWDQNHWPVINGGQRVTLTGTGALPALARAPGPVISRSFGAATLDPHWVHLRNPVLGNYVLSSGGAALRLLPSVDGLSGNGSPTAVFRRQEGFLLTLSAVVDFNPDQVGQEAGMVVYRSTDYHAELGITHHEGRRHVVYRRRVGSLMMEQFAAIPAGQSIRLAVQGDRDNYTFSCVSESEQNGGAQQVYFSARHETRHLSTEISDGFIGAMPGLYAIKGPENASQQVNWAEFSRLYYEVKD